MSNVYRMKDVAALTGVCSVTVRRWVMEGNFPKPIRLGPNSIGFVREEVDAWFAAKRAERIAA